MKNKAYHGSCLIALYSSKSYIATVATEILEQSIGLSRALVLVTKMHIK